MNETDFLRGRVHRAHDQLKTLDGAHQKFLKHIDAYDPEPTAGVLSVLHGEIVVRSMGHELVAHTRPIVVDRDVKAMEYKFSVKVGESLLAIRTFFLGSDECLYNDIALKDKAFEVRNKYSGAVMLDLLAVALLDSDVFRPS